MSTFFLTLASIALTAAGAAYLTAHDAKRRRAFRLSEGPAPRRKALTWTALYLPGVALLILDQWAAFLMWLGGAPLIGWAIAVTPPETYARLRQIAQKVTPRRRQIGDRLNAVLSALGPQKLSAVASYRPRIADLEARIAALEEQLAAKAKDARKGRNDAFAPAEPETGNKAESIL
ncbi:MAG: hypothetical protein AAF354_14005 [Pseudomonadota bacterium]